MASIYSGEVQCLGVVLFVCFPPSSPRTTTIAIYIDQNPLPPKILVCMSMFFCVCFSWGLKLETHPANIHNQIFT